MTRLILFKIGPWAFTTKICGYARKITEDGQMYYRIWWRVFRRS